MQDSSNFEALIKKWNRMSTGEEVENKKFGRLASMSGDSSNHETLLKTKDDDSKLLVPQQSPTTPLATVSTGIAASTLSDVPLDHIGVIEEEKQELIKKNKEDCKEGVCDTDTNNKDKNENTCEQGTLTETERVPILETKRDPVLETKKENVGDNTDSVFLRSPPPHKTRSTAPTPPEEENCGMKCLYYTLQCCDCILM